MAHYQNQYSAQAGSDAYGYPIRQTDEYGNVISETGQYVDTLRRTDEQYPKPSHESEQQQPVGISHNEKVVITKTTEDGSGHHKKKRIIEKIKEKLLGGHHWEG